MAEGLFDHLLVDGPTTEERRPTPGAPVRDTSAGAGIFDHLLVDEMPSAAPEEPEGPGLVDTFVTGVKRGYQTGKQQVGIGGAVSGAMDPAAAASLIAGAEREKATMPVPPAAEKLAGAKTWGDVWDAVRAEPGAFTTQMAHFFGENLPQQVPGAVAGAGGFLAGGIPGAAVGVGAGSAVTEGTAQFLETLAKMGVDLADEKQVEAALRDDVLVNDIMRVKAIPKAAVVAAFDVASMGMAGRFIAGARGVGSALVRGTGEVGMQAGAGMGGEYFGSKAAGNEPNAGDLALEGMLEVVPGGVAETAVGAYAHRRGGKTVPPGGAAAPAPPPSPAARATTAAPAAPPAPPLSPLPETARAVAEQAGSATGEATVRGGTEPPPIPVAAPPGGPTVSPPGAPSAPGATAEPVAGQDIQFTDRATGEQGQGRVVEIGDVETGPGQTIRNVVIDLGQGRRKEAALDDLEIGGAAPPVDENAQSAPSVVHPAAQPVDPAPEPGGPVLPGTGDGSPSAPVAVQTPEDLARAGQRVDTAPTEAMKEAGNYRKGHVKVAGLDISIENPKGSTRSGTDADGKPWQVAMTADYGYVKRTEGADGDQVDVYVGPNPEAPNAFIVDQVDAETGRFDEHKVVLGAASRAEAEALYDAHFSDGKGPQRRGAVTELPVAGLKDWLKNGDTANPYGVIAKVPRETPAAEPVVATPPAEPEPAPPPKPKTPIERRAVAVAKIDAELAADPKPARRKELEAQRERLVAQGLPRTPASDEHPGLVIKSLQTGKETTIQPKGTVPPAPEWYRSLTPEGRRQLAVAAGYTGPDPVQISKMSWATIAGRPDLAQKMAERFEREKAPKAEEGRRRVGTNYDGQMVEEDERGVRSYARDGVRTTEPVRVDPRGGIVRPTNEDRIGRGNDAFLTSDELRAMTAGRGDEAPSGPRVMVNIVGPDGLTDAERVAKAADRTPKDIGKEAFAAGKPRRAPHALSPSDQREWNRGWDEANVAEPVPGVSTAAHPDNDPSLAKPKDDGESYHNPRPGEITVETLGGFKVGDRVTVPSRTIGPSTIEKLWVRDAGASTINYAKVRNDAGQPLGLGISELRKAEPAKPKATPQVPPLAGMTPLGAKPAEKPADFGAKNKLVNQDRAAELQARLRNKFKTQLNSGIDPEILAIGTELSVFYIEGGVRKFADVAQRVAQDIGATMAQLRPYLRSWYNGARDMMEDAGLDVSGMDSPDQVRAGMSALFAGEKPEQPAGEGATIIGAKPETGDEQGGRPEAGDLGEAGVGDPGEGLATGRGDGDRPAGAVEPGEAQDDGGTASPRRGARSGSRSGASVRRGATAEPGSGDGADRRDGAGGTGLVDAGAGGRDGPAATRPNYHVTDPEQLIGGTPKVRFSRNRKAIEAFRAVTEEGRDPTPEELDAMAGYIGWGSFGQELFQGTWERPQPKDGWANEDRWLREHLGRQEWESAQGSIINAHYTDPPTVTAMWDMVRHMGFAGGRVLEPSVGIGNFFGMMPRDLMAASDLTGIEMDRLTGGMAKLLYPGANIQIKPYQDSRTPDGFYDLVIGNWPFAAQGPADRRYSKLNASLHDYFFVKALDQVRPGGLVVGITSSGTMDKVGRPVRIHLAKNAELVAAYRLPSGAFEKYAGTAVVTDIIVLKKREKPLPTADGQGWVESAKKEFGDGEINLNEYWDKNPSHILGKLGFGSGTTFGRAGMIVTRTDDFAKKLAALPGRMPEGAFSPIERGSEPRFITNNTKDRQGAVTVQDGKLYVVRGERLQELQSVSPYRVKDAKTTKAREDQVKALVDMRRAYGALIDAERDAKDGVEDLRKTLRRQYETFAKKHGRLSRSDGITILSKAGDPFTASLEALETPDGKPARILFETTIRGKRTLENPSPRDAYVLARNESLRVDMDRVAEIAGKDRDAVVRELVESKAVYRTPGGSYEAADVYLSGNVRRKLREALEAKDAGEDMDVSIEALRSVVPKDTPYFNIEAKLGASWVDNDDYRQFIADLLGMSKVDDIDVRFTAGRWKVRFSDRVLNHRPEATTTWGSVDYKFDRMVTAAMGNQTVTIRKRDENGDQYVDEAATKEVNEKITRLREEFSSWAWRDAERRVRLEGAYNETMNAIATPRFDGGFLEFPGMALRRGNDPFSLRKHQVDAIWRGVANGRGLYAHEVGTGKTYTMGGIAVESRRYGIARKPLILAHNANSATVAREINEMYPGAKVLYVDNLTPATIDVTLQRIANDDWDAVVIPHSLIDRMALSEETLNAIAAEEIAALEEEAIEAASEDGANLSVDMFDDEKAMQKVRSPTAKQLVHERNRIKETIRKMAQRASREGAIKFEDLGIDMILVDEVHEFKKPPIVTKMRVRGLNTQTSDRSIALRFLTDYLRNLNSGKGVHVFTGTPITNTLAEIYNMMRYVMEDQMARDGVKDWDAWFNTFADTESEVELTASGEYEPVTRLSEFVNVAELRRMAGEFMDIVFADDMPEFKPRQINGKTLTAQDLSDAERDKLVNGTTETPVGRPYKKIINDIGPMSPAQQEALQRLARLSREFKEASKKQRRDWMLAGDEHNPVIIETAAANAGLDVRLYDKEAEDHPESKVNRVTRNVLDIYGKHDDATQVIFVERGYTSATTRTERRGDEKVKVKVERFNMVAEIVEKLVAGGMKRGEITIVDGSVSKARRKEAADKMNSGEIRVVIGNTQTLGVGVNMQRNLRAMHHMDAPWMPGELEQRNGRGWRQGNRWNTVLEYRYITDRLDGRRWQVLAVKDRFIKGFLKADENVRVISGDAVSLDEGESAQDLTETLAAAAGDPRLLLKNKLQADVRKLENRERQHTFGIADAKQRARRLRGQIKEAQESLPKLRAAAERYAAAHEKGFTATVNGKTYDERAEAQDAIDEVVKGLASGDRDVPIGSVQGFEIRATWSKLADEPYYTILHESGGVLVKPSVASAEATLRNQGTKIEQLVERIADFEASAARMEAAAEQPFAQAEMLERKRQQLTDLIADLGNSPAPPPSWLRQGAPIGTAVHVMQGSILTERVVEGHRWDDDDYVILTDKGEISYLKALDENGTRIFDVRPVQPPPKKEAAEKGKEASKFRRGDDGATAGDLIPITHDISGVRTPEWAAQREKVARQVGHLIERMTGRSGVAVEVADSLLATDGAEQFEVYGGYSPLDHLVTVSLRTEDVESTVRHETIHILRRTGILSDKDWGTLIKAARDNRWLDKHDIVGRYPNLEGDRNALYEEAIAEEFGKGDYRSDVRSAAVQAIFRRIARFLREVRAIVRRALRKNPDFMDLFSAIETGRMARGDEMQPAGRVAMAFERLNKVFDRFIADTPENAALAESHLRRTAELIGVPFEAMGMGGRLSIQIGGKDAEALISSDAKVPGAAGFTVQNEKGVILVRPDKVTLRTVAHEWMHSLDNFLAKSPTYTPEWPAQPIPRTALATEHGNRRMRPAVLKAWKELNAALRDADEYTNGMKAIDKELGVPSYRPYAASRAEMLAYSFDSYLSEKAGEAPRKRTGPLGAERERINAAFDGLFAAFKTRPSAGSGALELYQRDVAAKYQRPVSDADARAQARAAFGNAVDPDVAVITARRDLRQILRGLTRPEDASDGIEVGEVETERDISWFKRMLYTPEAIFRALERSDPRIGKPLKALWKQAVKLEVDQSEFVNRLRRDATAIMDKLDTDQQAAVGDLLFTGDAYGVEFSDADLTELGVSGPAAQAYRKMRAFFDKLGRYVDNHERKMKPALRRRKFQLIAAMARQTGRDPVAFRQAHSRLTQARARLRNGDGDPEVLTEEVERLEAEAFGTQIDDDAMDTQLAEWDAEVQRIETRLAQTTVRLRQGYVPHKFFGSWAVYREEQKTDADGNVVTDDEGDPVMRWALVAAPRTGFHPDRDSAVRAANAYKAGHPGERIAARPVAFKFPNSDATELSDAAYWRFVNRVTDMLSPDDEDMAVETGDSSRDAAHELIHGVARRRFRRRMASFKQARLGIAGYSRDLNRVLDTHIGEVVRYATMDELKFAAINTMEKAGLSRNRSVNQKNPTLQATVEQWFRDINGEKQATERQIDDLLSRPWARPLNAALGAGAAAFVATGGITGNPLIGAAVGSYVGWRFYSSLANAGAFKSRALTGTMLGDMAHLKLGAFFNVFSAAVNLSQTAMNTIPILGTADTMKGMGRYIKAMQDSFLGRDNTDIQLLRRANVDTAFKFAEVSPHLFQRESKLAHYSMWLFTQAESLNRGTAFLGAYGKADRDGASPARAMEAAKALMQRTQFHYGTSNRPEVLRNVFLRVPLQFKNFMAQQLTFVFGLDRRELPKFMLSLFLMAGLIGLPGAELLDLLSDQLFDFSPIVAVKRLMLEAQASGGLGGTVAAALVHGLPALFGVDISGRVGLGDVLPKQLRDVEGPWLSTLRSARQIGETNATVADHIRNLTTGVGAPLKALEAWRNGGQVTNPYKRGRLEYEATPAELLLKSVGGMPVREALMRDVNEVTARTRAKYTADSGRYLDRIVAGVQAGNPDAVREAIAAAGADGVRVTPAQIRRAVKDAGRPRLERLISQMPKAMRGETSRLVRAATGQEGP